MSKNITNRREVLKLLGTGSAALLANGCRPPKVADSHIITLSFDDGFERSTRKTVEVYERYGLKACINVIATAHEKDFELPNEYHRWPAGDFDMWNDLKQKGYKVMPPPL